MWIRIDYSLCTAKCKSSTNNTWLPPHPDQHLLNQFRAPGPIVALFLRMWPWRLAMIQFAWPVSFLCHVRIMLVQHWTLATANANHRAQWFRFMARRMVVFHSELHLLLMLYRTDVAFLCMLQRVFCDVYNSVCTTYVQCVHTTVQLCLCLYNIV